MPRERWLEKRKAEILPTSYFHVVFTLPHELNTIILNNKKPMLNTLFKAASTTLLDFAKNELNATAGYAYGLGDRPAFGMYYTADAAAP